MHYNNFYAFSYVLCEVLNLLILGFNFYFTDAFLGTGDFANYGSEVVQFNKLDNTDGLISPMDRVFPKVSKCDFHKYGPSGGLIRYKSTNWLTKSKMLRFLNITKCSILIFVDMTFYAFLPSTLSTRRSTFSYGKIYNHFLLPLETTHYAFCFSSLRNC